MQATKRTIRHDLLLMVLGWSGAQGLFHGYEAHVPVRKRILKGGVLLGLLSAIRIFWGRRPFGVILGSMTLGIAILHGYWFHHRHGIHWRTAEPRHEYLRLIGESPTVS